MQEYSIKDIAILKLKVAHNELTYKEAKKLAKPALDFLNNKSKEAAKKYGRKPILITFESVQI